eukprot:TRINITY_DN20349_c0_g1_i1.p1 TRINITY_DN20349_c0_g1~~TRINITY_DN20349_c0_g1_i1.p1  ORF type:complete len:199 (-),score=12.07 TRINITY_DN20349_c0_g1_i1:63-659(-)
MVDSTLIDLARNCPNLASITLYKCDRLTDTSISEIATHCTRLSSINISRCMLLTTKSLEALATCSRLRRVRAAGDYLANNHAVIQLARSCPDLESVDFSYAQFITDAALCEVIKRCPGIKRIRACLTDVTRDTIDMIIKYSREIVELDLSGSMETIPYETWCSLAKSTPSLRSATITTTSFNMTALKHNYPKVEWLSE